MKSFLSIFLLILLFYLTLIYLNKDLANSIDSTIWFDLNKYIVDFVDGFFWTLWDIKKDTDDLVDKNFQNYEEKLDIHNSKIK